MTSNLALSSGSPPEQAPQPRVRAGALPPPAQSQTSENGSHPLSQPHMDAETQSSRPRHPQQQPPLQSQSQAQSQAQGPSQLAPQSQPQPHSHQQSQIQQHRAQNPQWLPPTANPSSHSVSPPSKRDLRSWWKGFKLPSKHQDTHDPRPQGIFGVPLRQSITYANVAISLIDENGKSYIYGYVPIVVAKCGVFLKEKATGVEGIFRLSGSEKRIKELKTIFDSPDRYGKGLVWDGYTVHDAANVLRRYLNDLPEPVVPLDLYEKFREPLRGATRQAVGDTEGPQFVDSFDMGAAIAKYQSLITELPPLNRQLLLYILDLLAVFAAKADENRMNSQNLAAIFQPGMLSHPAHAMAPEEYRLNQCVIIFLIENQDHFLIGMQGTAADEKTVQEVQKGTPPTTTPATPNASRKPGVQRSSSNASAGAESVARDGKIRRNRSTSSRHSRHSNGAPSPGSPAVGSAASGGLGRSNTLPSKRSPAIGSGRFLHNVENTASPISPQAPATPTPIPPSPTVIAAAPPVAGQGDNLRPASRTAALGIPLLLAAGQARTAGRSQEGLLEPTTPDGLTPARERKLQSLFQRSPTGDVDTKQPNKLRKKRLASSANQSAQSSTTSLPQSASGVSPAAEATNPMEEEEEHNDLDPPAEDLPPAGPSSAPSLPEETACPTPPAQPSNVAHPANVEHALRPQNSPSQSLHSSFNEGSDLDQADEPALATEQSGPEKDKRRRWRLSRRREDMATTAGPSQASGPKSTRQVQGLNTNAEVSTSSVGSGSKQGRRSFNAEHPDTTVPLNSEGQSSHESTVKEGRDETRGLTGWIKNKYREAKENHDQRRNKSPPAGQVPLGSTNLSSARQKSLDNTASPEEDRAKP